VVNVLDEQSDDAIRELAEIIAKLLRRVAKYTEYDELVGYASVGLVMAALDYDPEASEIQARRFLIGRGRDRAVDLMRKDRVIDRSWTKNKNPVTGRLDHNPDMDDDRNPALATADDGQKNVDDSDMVEYLMSALSQEDRLLVCCYYGMGMTLADIGRLFGITDTAAVWRRKRAVNKMRKLYENRK
jgi:RNA polymerase sigma factor (sigma-70 family)